jgi:hypothetical protein
MNLHDYQKPFSKSDIAEAGYFAKLIDYGVLPHIPVSDGGGFCFAIRSKSDLSGETVRVFSFYGDTCINALAENEEVRYKHKTLAEFVRVSVNKIKADIARREQGVSDE